MPPPAPAPATAPLPPPPPRPPGKRPAEVIRVAFVASPAPDAQEALGRLQRRYGSPALADADVVVALGGDGFMLQTMHRFLDAPARAAVPIFGMNRGSVGFLMNAFSEDELLQRVANAEQARLRPLRMTVRDEDGGRAEWLAVNEVSLLRQSRQAAKIRITVDGVVRLPELICDGVLVATPAGSTAYNLSANGPVIPLGTPLLALTPVSPFRPRRWRGALLPSASEIRFEVLEGAKRPVSAVADDAEVRGVAQVDVREDDRSSLVVLFDPHHDLRERILGEQFSI